MKHALRIPIEVLPLASNHLILKSGDIEITVQVATEGKQIHIQLSDNAHFESDKYLTDNKHYLNVIEG